jgi:hypothetical protein
LCNPSKMSWLLNSSGIYREYKLSLLSSSETKLLSSFGIHKNWYLNSS